MNKKILDKKIKKNKIIIVTVITVINFVLLQSPYAISGAPAKFPGGFMPTGPLPIASPAYGAVPMLPHMPYAARAPSQIVRILNISFIFNLLNNHYNIQYRF